MGFGYALGGVASGLQNQEEIGNKQAALALSNLTLQSNMDFRNRALGIQADKVQAAQEKALLASADKNLAQTMKIITETITHSAAAGQDPAKTLAAVQPLMDHVDQLATAAGKDPSAYHQQVETLAGIPAHQPNAVEAINRKIAAGQPLTPGEQALKDSQRHLSVKDQLLLDAMNGKNTSTATPATAAPPVSGATTMNVSPSGQARPIPTPYQLQILKQNANNKDAKAAFDETFGPGAADHFLQGGS